MQVLHAGALCSHESPVNMCVKGGAAGPADGRANQALIDRRPPGGRADCGGKNPFSYLGHCPIFGWGAGGGIDCSTEAVYAFGGLKT